MIVITIYTVALILLLVPLCIPVLYISFQRWRHQRSVPTGQTTSHSDFLTYHTIAIEISAVLGSVFYVLGVYSRTEALMMIGMLLFCIVFPGHTLLHSLTCVEPYLAVVHPITYHRLRQSLGGRIRNITLGCVWLLCFGWIGVTIKCMPEFPALPLFCLMGISIIVVLFFFFSVLKVLTRPGPGGGPRERVDQSKQRALHIITAIVGALLLRFVALLLSTGLYNMKSIDPYFECILIDAGLIVALPSSLVQPLLFLHRAGKLACCRQNWESG